MPQPCATLPVTSNLTSPPGCGNSSHTHYSKLGFFPPVWWSSCWTPNLLQPVLSTTLAEWLRTRQLTERAFRDLHPGLVYTVGQSAQANTMMLVKGQVFPGARKSPGLLDTQPKCLHVGSWACLGVFLHECDRVSAPLCAKEGRRVS